MSNVTGCSTEVLSSIATLFSNIVDPDDPKFCSAEHTDSLDVIERSLTYCTQIVEDRSGEPKCPQTEIATKVAELYRLAGLVYLYRAARGLPTNAAKVRSVVGSAFGILPTLSILQRAFPLVILGCEAKTDDERLIILDLLERNRTHRELEPCCRIRSFIEASWAQDDLHTEKEVNYVRKMDAIISLSKNVPSFA